MRDRADEQRVLADRRFERDGFEQIGAGAREDRQGLALGGVVGFEVRLDALGVLVEALPLRRLFGHRLRALVEHFAHELLMLLAAVLIGREVEVKADHGKRTGL